MASDPDAACLDLVRSQLPSSARPVALDEVDNDAERLPTAEGETFLDAKKAWRIRLKTMADAAMAMAMEKQDIQDHIKIHLQMREEAIQLMSLPSTQSYFTDILSHAGAHIPEPTPEHDPNYIHIEESIGTWVSKPSSECLVPTTNLQDNIRNCMELALRAGSIEWMKAMLDTKLVKAIPDDVKEAIRFCQPEIMKVLIGYGADADCGVAVVFNTQYDMTGFLLHTKDPELSIRFLLSAGANKCRFDLFNGEFRCLPQEQALQCLRVLLLAGLDPNSWPAWEGFRLLFHESWDPEYAAMVLNILRAGDMWEKRSGTSFHSVFKTTSSSRIILALAYELVALT